MSKNYMMKGGGKSADFEERLNICNAFLKIEEKYRGKTLNWRGNLKNYEKLYNRSRRAVSCVSGVLQVGLKNACILRKQ